MPFFTNNRDGQLSKKIDILYPSIFDSKIISGVTKKNDSLYPGKGFSIPGKILTTDEVLSFRRLLADNLSVGLESLKFQKQVHEDTIRIISAQSPELPSDGMISNCPGIVLNVTIADCCAILVHDERNSAIGAFHSGWKGTKLNIAVKGIQRMKEEYGSRSGELKVFLSPCAGPGKYEVQEDVARYFPLSSRLMPGGRYLLNLRSEIRRQLIGAGVRDENIEVSDVCTISSADYHSFRRDKEKSGRMSAFIGIRG